ncbi:insulinase family protein [Pontixanthobacter gangjinensis]|uniref:Insulinase family protein n=1 Tax=Pontixanthobacter gangjinensis TaxID=1028742 RepID=A0A6I4SP04_9SPHN|nr:M16 family metallopeptidase [Pontixanthobacter gangjinensis]MXO57493.1 insulinase family protein [Pontixanthobacter gangjinensis]
MKSPLFARLALSLLLSTALAAPIAAQEAAAEPASGESAAIAEGWDAADWDLADSEFLPEAGWKFGTLDNGMRYIIRQNDRPEKTALVRMVIGTGSIDERDEEQGFAHYLEHMAFNGSTNVPEGEMIKLLEREGLAFGADTNASTGFDETQYILDLPRADPALLDTALMLMRETVSELTIAPEAVERERGVILSERRVRNNYNFKNVVEGLRFAYPEARLGSRLPIGTIETLEGATAEGLRAFWSREYVPADTVLVIVGDFDPALVEGNIRTRFADWESAESPDQPPLGPVDPGTKGQTTIYLDPALTESVTITRHGAYIDRPDTVEERRKSVLRQLGDRVISRRLQRLLRDEDPPFRGVSVSSSDFFDEARTTQLVVASQEGGWQRGLDAAIDEYRRALIYGFTKAEIAEQISNYRTSLENAAANVGTRTNNQLVSSALAIISGDNVPDSPQNTLDRFNAAVAVATPETVLAELRANAVELDEPLIRFTGKVAPEGGEDALRSAVDIAYARDVAPPVDSGNAEFGYTDFGTPGAVVSDMKTANLDIRTLRFANGVMLNLKPTDLEDDRVTIRVNIDGGTVIETRENPMAVTIAGLLTSGGLGKHSSDQLQSILAGRSVGGSFGAGELTFISSARTTPRDLELQLQLLTAYITDPGYRAEGLGLWKKGLEDFFATLGKTPGSAFGEASSLILSDNDPRFVRPPLEAYQALDYYQLKGNIADRLDNGAIEIGIVGDFDADQAIALVAKTFGALPQREPEFREYNDERRQRSFTDNRQSYTIEHDGEPDQAMLQLVWPTTDNEDWTETSQFNLLSRVTQLMLTEKLREELGQTYSPSVGSSLSSLYRDYGTFSMSASVDISQLDAAKSAMDQVIADLLAAEPDADLIQRARQPVLESLDNRLKTNGGWMGVVDRAQSKPEDLLRFLTTKARYEAMTGAELLALARKYLQPDQLVEFRVVPSDVVLAKASEMDVTTP